MTTKIKAIDKYILSGDLNRLSPEEQVEVYREMCEAYNLDHRLKPFEILELQGMKKIYFSKAGCDLLASSRNLTRKVKNIEIDEATLTMQCECEVIDKINDRTDSDFAYKSIAKYAPAGAGKPPELKMLQGKELANEKLKLISQAKRRATLSFVGATMAAAEDVQNYESEINPPVEQNKEQQDTQNVLPIPKDTEEKKQAEEPKKEVKKKIEKPIDKEPETKIDYLVETKAFIKEAFGTLKKFKEETGFTPEDLTKKWENEAPEISIKEFFESVKPDSDEEEIISEIESFKLDEEEKEFFSHSNSDHKKLVVAHLQKILPEWRSEPVLLRVLSAELVKATNKVELKDLNSFVENTIIPCWKKEKDS